MSSKNGTKCAMKNCTKKITRSEITSDVCDDHYQYLISLQRETNRFDCHTPMWIGHFNYYSKDITNFSKDKKKQEEKLNSPK